MVCRDNLQRGDIDFSLYVAVIKLCLVQWAAAMCPNQQLVDDRRKSVEQLGQVEDPDLKKIKLKAGILNTYIT